jgi:prepilin signal peptidase PulO-like enzyme (type II secretory pathway)
VTWPGFGLGLAFSWAVPPDDGIAYMLVHSFWRHPSANWLGVLDALIGAAFGSLLFLGAGWAYRMVRHREGLGLGDVKMMTTVGAFLGLRGAFLTILLGTLLGSVIGIGLIATLYATGWKCKLAERANRRGLGKVGALRWTIASQYQLPLGTFLGIAALLVVFFAQQGFFERLAVFH